MSVRATIQDVRNAGYCASGARRWFEAYDLNFRAFLSDGIDAEILRGTGDALGIRVANVAEERMTDG